MKRNSTQIKVPADAVHIAVGSDAWDISVDKLIQSVGPSREDRVTIHVEAIYENGTFRPATPVSLREGDRVALTVELEPPLVSSEKLVAALAEIASLPAQSLDDGFSGADHDALLYGPEGAR